MESPNQQPCEKPGQSSSSSDKSTEAFEELLGLLTDLNIIDKQKKEENKNKLFIKEELEKDKKVSVPTQKINFRKNRSDKKKSREEIKIDIDSNQSNCLLNGKTKTLENKYYEPDETVNLLLPLMIELLDSPSQSPEKLKELITPIIDEIIKGRSQQDPIKMSAVIAELLPRAIAQEIENSPQEIAKAIAPEIALAIQNQITLDREAISQTLGPEMGQAIKTQIEVERDAMVDALYPVIGNTISKYMVELAKSINDKVENALSIEGFKRKIRAKINGISEAELILQESVNFSVQAVLLIHKASGLIISEAQTSSNLLKEVDLFAGMLTAIRDFVNDCVALEGKVSEVHEIKYDDAKIILEVAGYCYLAVIIQGVPSKVFIKKIHQTLSDIILKSGRTIQEFQGDKKTIPQFIKPKLQALIEDSEQEKKSKPPIALLAILLLILTTIGITVYRGKVAYYWEKQTIQALDATPELSVYRLIPQVKLGQLILTGRVPDVSLKQQAENVSRRIAPHLTVKNQITAVDIPPHASAIAAEVQRVTRLLNQRDGVHLKSQYQDHVVNITGFVFNLKESEQISQAFAVIPGVNKIVTTLQSQPFLDTRIYFESNSSEFKAEDISSSIRTIQKFLAEHPQVNLKIIGHSDSRGSASQKKMLAQARAEAVKQVLLQNKVNPSRLIVGVSLQPPPGVTANQPLWLSRCVSFEILIRGN